MIARRFLLGVVALAALITSEAASADPASHGAHVSAQPPRFGAASSAGIADAHDLFIRASLETPVAGACEMLSPDPAYVSEMLTRFGDNGAKTFERRVALVLGNGAYRNFGALKNPSNDAASMALMFRALGFTVYRSVDATTASLEDCLGRFKGDLAAKPADIALLFYAGHGVQLTSSADSEKRNYMLAVDASVDAAGNAKGFKQIDSLLADMRAHAMQSVFLYDACRNSPLGQTLVARADGAAVTRQTSLNGAAAIGEADVESGPGIFIAYATSPNRTADDAWGPAGSPHSPFTQALLQNLPTPGATIDEAFARAFNTVGELTAWKQTPWTSSSLTRKLQLNGAFSDREVKARSESFAAQAGQFRMAGQKGKAIASAMKGLPPAFAEGEPFGAALVELSRAHQSRNLSFAETSGALFGTPQAAFSRDGKVILRLATSSIEEPNPPPDLGVVQLWDAKLGEKVADFESPSGKIEHAALSPDGLLLVTATLSGTVEVWDTKARTVLARFAGPEKPTFVEFSPFGSHFAVATTELVRAFDVRTMNETARFMLPGANIRRVAFNPTATRLAAVDPMQSSFRVWDLATRQEKSIAGGSSLIQSIQFSPVGGAIAIGDAYGGIRTLDSVSGALIRRFQEPVFDIAVSDPASIVRFSEDGASLAVASNKGRFTRWNAATGAVEMQAQGQEEPLDLSRDFRLLVSGTMQRLRVTELADTSVSIGCATSIVSDISLSPDGARVAVTRLDKGVFVCDAKTGAVLMALAGTEKARSARYDPTGQRIVTSEIAPVAAAAAAPPPPGASPKSSVRVWDAASGAALTTLFESDADLRYAEYNAKGDMIAVASSDGAVSVIDAKDGSLIRRVSMAPNSPMRAHFNRRGDLLMAWSSARTVQIWNIGTGAEEAALTIAPPNEALGGTGGGGIVQPVSAIFAGPSDDLVTTGFTEPMKIWRASDRWTSPTTIALVAYTVAAHPDGRRAFISTGDDFHATVIDYEVGQTIAEYPQRKPVFRTAAAGAGVNMVAMAGIGAAVVDIGPYGDELVDSAHDQLTEKLRAEVERDRIRYWELDPSLLQ